MSRDFISNYLTLIIAVSLFLQFPMVESALSMELRSYYIDCDQDEFDYIIEDPWENRYIDCTLEYNRQVWRNAQIRIRGESSRGYPKKSFKVNFDSDNRFFNRDKINLISEWMDSTYCREYLAYDFFTRAGLPASRTWFTRLYVNDRYMGLYLDVEQVDECFLRRAGLPSDASIYKANDNGCLLRPSDRMGDVWSKETNEETGYYDLLDLIEWLDTTPDESFYEELPDYFNVEELTRVIAANGLIGNSSTYYHNYYLIHDLDENGIWRMLPWDMDKTFKYNSSYSHPYFYRSGMAGVGSNILVVRCWRNPQLRNLIYQQLNGMIDSLFVEEYYSSMSDTLVSLLREAVEEDTMKQYTSQQFINGVTAFPDEVSGRSERILMMMEGYPVPFDLRTAHLTPVGVFLSWDETFIPDSAEFSYNVVIDTSKYLNSENRIIIEDINSERTFLNDISAGSYYWKAYARSESGHNTHPLSFYSSFKIPENAFDATVISGTIEESVTWSLDESPYSLPEGLTIAPGAVLTIEPGVLVGIGAECDLQIRGGLSAIGTCNDSIRFTPLDPDEPWNSVFLDYPTDPVELCYVTIYGGDYLLRSRGGTLNVFDAKLMCGTRAVQSYQTDIHLERVWFENLVEEPVHSIYNTAIVRSCRFSNFPIYSDSDLIDFDFVTDFLIERCRFYRGSDDAIDLQTVTQGRIINNIITKSYDKGISIGSEHPEIYIANNIITDCKLGIGVKTYSGVELYNNIIAFCDSGLWVAHPAGGGNAFVRNTILWRNEREIILGDSAEIDIAYSMIRGEEDFPGEGNHREDAHFIDQWNKNFILTEESPLIDAGYGTGHPTLDYYDAPRVDSPHHQNTGAGNIRYVDIGTFEYGSVGEVSEEEFRPVSFRLLNYPNPFNSVTRIEFTLMTRGSAVVEIFDISGRRVFHRTFDNAELGTHALLWSGISHESFKPASGLYLCRVTQAASSRTIKLMLIR